MTQKSKVVKKRNWAFVAYPESMPNNWLEILQQTGAPIAISPLHDKDLNADEIEKKSHYHIIICYNGPTSFNVVKCITDKLNAPIPIALEQIKGYYRYFTHKDNPEKAQYSEADIICLNGFVISDYVEISRNEIDKIKLDIIDLIDNIKIYEYCDLIQFLKNDNFEYFKVASSNTLFFNAYLKSKRYKDIENGKY